MVILRCRPEVQAFGHFMAFYGILAFLPKSLIRNQIRIFRFFQIFRLFPSPDLDFPIPQLYITQSPFTESNVLLRSSLASYIAFQPNISRHMCYYLSSVNHLNSTSCEKNSNSKNSVSVLTLLVVYSTVLHQSLMAFLAALAVLYLHIKLSESLTIINLSERPIGGHYLTFLTKPLNSLAVHTLPRCFL